MALADDRRPSSSSSLAAARERGKGLGCGVSPRGRRLFKVADFSEQMGRWRPLLSRKLGQMFREEKYRGVRGVEHMRFVRAMKKLGFHDNNNNNTQSSVVLDSLTAEQVMEVMVKEDKEERILHRYKASKALYLSVPNDGRWPAVDESRMTTTLRDDHLEVPNAHWVAEYLAHFRSGSVPPYVMSRAFVHLVHVCIDKLGGAAAYSDVSATDDIWELFDEDLQPSVTIVWVRFYLAELCKLRAQTGDPNAMIDHSDRIPFVHLELKPLNRSNYVNFLTWKSECERVSRLLGIEVYVFYPRPIYSCCPPWRVDDSSASPYHSHPHKKVMIMTLPDGTPYCNLGVNTPTQSPAEGASQYHSVLFTDPDRLLEAAMGGSPSTEPMDHGPINNVVFKVRVMLAQGGGIKPYSRCRGGQKTTMLVMIPKATCRYLGVGVKESCEAWRCKRGR